MPKSTATEKESTAVATPDGTAVVTPYDPSLHDGMSGEFDQGDIALPTCSLVQPMSQDRGEAGTYHFAPEGRNAETFTGVVLNIIGTAAMWEPIGSEAKGPICKSMDRVMGLTAKPSVVLSNPDQPDSAIYIECARCPHHPDWEVMKSGPMHCSKGFTLLMVDAQTEEPFLYYVKGTQFTPVKNRVVSPALLRRKRYGNAEPWLTPFTFTSRLVEQPGKKFWVPVIEMGKPFEEAQRAYYAELSQSLAGRAEKQAEEELLNTMLDDDGQQTTFDA